MNSPVARESKQTLFFAIFALSGFSGLIYESIWTHYLKLFLGHAAYAQTLVLVIFMGGMAVGAWVAAKYSHRAKNALLAYAVVEALIGMAALIFQPLFVNATGWAYDSVIPSIGSPAAIDLFKWGLSSALILPQSILLGSTFPLMSTGILRRFPALPGQSLAMLYFTNSIGASLGVLASGFWLIDTYGLPGTMTIAGIINLAVALVVYLQAIGDNYQPIEEELDLTQGSNREERRKFLALFFAIAFFTGAASFFYEIGWIRMLALVLGASNHAFELMLSTFILGLALGGFYIKRKIDSLENPVLTLALVQLVMGGLALATLLFYNQTFLWMSTVVQALQKTEFGYLLFNVFSHGIAMLVMLPATVCAGMTLPLITYLLFSNGYGEKSVGAVYASNTFGSIVGIVLAVQLVMPALGLKSVIVTGAAIDIALGLFLLYLVIAGQSKVKFFALAAGVVYLFIMVGATAKFDQYRMSSGVFRHGFSKVADEVLFHRDGKTASVDIIKSGSSMSISTNGKPDAQISMGDIPGLDEPTMMMVAAVPMAIKGQSAVEVANIGLGSGLTVNTLLQTPLVKKVDTIEIEPAIVQGAKYFGARVEKTFNDPRSEIHIEDAKTFFTSNQKKYDLILSEPSNVWVSGVAGLFSREFYVHTKRYLKPDGLFVQWFHVYETEEEVAVSIVKALSSVFKDYKLYLADNADILIIAADYPIPDIQYDIFQHSEIKTAMTRIGVNSLTDLQIRFLGSKSMFDYALRSYSVPANSDFFPVVDQRAVKARFLKKDALSIITVAHSPVRLDFMDYFPVSNSAEDSIGKNDYMYIAERARVAKLIARLAGDSFNTNNDEEKIGANHKLLVTLNALQQGAGSCPSKSFATMIWFPAVLDAFQKTIPFLNHEQNLAILSAVRRSACNAQLSDQYSIWMKFFTALSQAEYEQVAVVAGSLLSVSKSENFNGALDASQIDYLYAWVKLTAIQANIKLGNFEKALQINREANVNVTNLTFLTQMAVGAANAHLEAAAKN